MDERVRRHAEILADHCLDVEAGDEVLISAPPAAEDLVVALYRVFGERNVRATWLGTTRRGIREHLRAIDDDAVSPLRHVEAAVGEVDGMVSVRASRNHAELSDVPGETQTAYQRAMQETFEVVMDANRVITQYPEAASAQQAEMSTDAYREFVWSAIDKDWAAQHEHQAQLVDLLSETDEVHIRAGETTDVRFSVEGMVPCNDDGRNNLPGGEVFTAPHPESVEGEVLFDLPVHRRGRTIEDAHLVFEAGEVVEFEAARNEATLAAMLETDDGARRVGEVGFGMNRDIDRLTKNMLFDEKTGDTIHLALGRAIDESVPAGREANHSALHLDMLFDVSADSEVRFDGEAIQRDGTFVFEDGFEG